MGDKTGSMFVSLLTKFAVNLNYLNLNNSQIGNETIQALQLCFSTDTCKIKGLRIAHNNLHDHDICKLSFGLCYYKDLRALDLENCKVCKIGANAICNIVKENSKLTFLNISGNSFETTSIILLNKILSNHSNIRQLIMRNCLIGNEELK